MEDVHLVYRNASSYMCDCSAKLSLFGGELGGGGGRKANPSEKQNKTTNRLKYWFVSYEQSLRKGFS